MDTSLNKFLDAINSASSNTADVPEEGFYTINQLAKIWKIHRTTALEKITAGVEAGIVEQKIFRLQKLTRLYPTAHYRLKP